MDAMIDKLIKRLLFVRGFEIDCIIGCGCAPIDRSKMLAPDVE
jgi:hypothetical protein